MFSKVLKYNKIMLLSVSRDGKYALSTDDFNTAILWDLKKHTQKTLDNYANIYSAYFLKDSQHYMWQDWDNVVHIENLNGQEIKNFKIDYEVYGHVMTTDLQHYFYSDSHHDLYKGYGEQRKLVLDMNGESGGIQLLNLSLDENEEKLLSSGSGSPGLDNIPLEAGTSAEEAGIEAMRNYPLLKGIVLWDVKSGKPTKKLAANDPGHRGKIYATISPNGKMAISGCNQRFAYVWDLKSGKYSSLYNLNYGKFLGLLPGYEDKPTKEQWDRVGLLPIPEDYTGSKESRTFPLILKYIDMNGHYLRIDEYSKYAVLYHESDPKPLKYLKFDSLSQHVDHSLKRNQAIDSSPQANILVMAKEFRRGIIIYKYNPESLTLKKEWVSGSEWFDYLADNVIIFGDAFLHIMKGLWVLCCILTGASHHAF